MQSGGGAGRDGNVVGFRLAGLEVWLDARGSGVPLALPACHAPFLASGAPHDGLQLRVSDGQLQSTKGWQRLFHDGDSWELWRDGSGRRVFVPSSHSPPRRQVSVDAAFRSGEVVGEFCTGQLPAPSVYPLRDIDMAVYANWLAESGDLILHAAGIDEEGVGYAFLGPSGAGKSTLAGELASLPSITVLGEDQVILRHESGEFTVYGTPWHTNPARCSPGGVPLRKLFFLDRANGHGIEPRAPRSAFELLMQNALIPYYNRAGVERILDTLPRLVEQVPCFTIGFQVGADVMALIRGA